MKLDNMTTAQVLLEILERLGTLQSRLRKREKHNTDQDDLKSIGEDLSSLIEAETALKTMMHREIDGNRW